MSISSGFYKFFFIFSLSLIFMISACSKPAEDKELPSKQIAETTKAGDPPVETPAQTPPKPELPKAETPEPTIPKPAPAPVAAPEPVVSEPVKPKPVTPEPAKESSFIDVITMENPAYPEHKKSIVLFTHKKHVEEYKITCGQCHHDKEGKPLNDLKENDKVDTCISCHTKIGQAPRPKDKKKLTRKEKLEFHAEAIHANCIDCHKDYNKENNTKVAPASCSKCHPKRK